MKKINKALLMTVISLGIIGCASPLPVAQNFPRSYQKVANTTQHWNIVAKDVAEQTEKMMAESESLQGRELYVPVGSRNSFFDSTFREFLIDQMVNKKMPVAVCQKMDLSPGFQQATELKVMYETRVVRHAEMPLYKPGLLTALAAGVYAVEGVSKLNNVDSRFIGGIALAAAVDTWAANMPNETKTELIITATIQDRNRFVLRKSLIYYVPDGDMELFTNRTPARDACEKNYTGTGGMDKQQVEDNREMEMNRLRVENVDRDMRRFNPDYKPNLVKTFY